MSIRPDMQSLADDLGIPVPAPEPGMADNVPRYTIAEFLGAHLYRIYRETAAREHSSILAVVRDTLRKARGEG